MPNFSYNSLYVTDGIFFPIQADRRPGIEGGREGAIRALSSRTHSSQHYKVLTEGKKKTFNLTTLLRANFQ